MRILIDGMDLSGKTTLAKALVAALQEAGIQARRNVGGLHKGWIDALAQRTYRWCRPGSALVSWLFAATALVDALRARRPAPGTVLVQEAYAEHTIAFAEGFGRRAAAWLVRRLRHWLPRFDLIVHLQADRETRERRFHGRGRNDAVDRLIFAAPDRFDSIGRRLKALLEAESCLALDTDRLSPAEVLAKVLAHCRAAAG
jgi:dTMP kinase